MSRSRKKNAVIKDVGHMAKLYNKIDRRVNKMRLKQGKELVDVKNLVCQYDISDYYGRFDSSDEEFNKIKRK